MSTTTLRPAQRPDTSALAHLANAANARSVLHKRIAPRQHEHATDYYLWRLNIVRQRFATPDLRTIVAEDPFTGEILGQASWAVEGSDTALYKRWTRESSWLTVLEGSLIWAEKLWCRYVTDKSVDYAFLDGFMAAFLGTARAVRPDCLHLHLIVIAPEAQGKGVGRMLVDWGKALAVQEDLPLFLEATLEAVGFYERGGFKRLGRDVAIEAEGQEAILIPAFVWEGEEREGRWLEPDGREGVPEGRWKWRDDVFAQVS
jgi:N-acetylglutamate synthase-like GNAT family acetyltransferase